MWYTLHLYCVYCGILTLVHDSEHLFKGKKYEL